MNAITTTERRSVTAVLAEKYNMDAQAFEVTVRETCSPKGRDSRALTKAEFGAFMVVANEYGLNPLTKEIYAFPAKGGGIVPVLSIDGWVSLVNSHKQCDGFEFEMEHDDKGALVACTCKMYRKDRSKPVAVTEYLDECIRPTEPWKMKHRMLRHKAMIQAARYAFGFSGIYDEDEGATIADMRDITPKTPPAPPPPPGEERDSETMEGEIVTEDGEVIENDAQEPFDPAEFFEGLEADLMTAADIESLEEAWTARDPMAVFDGDDVNQGIAMAIRKRAEKRLGGAV